MRAVYRVYPTRTSPGEPILFSPPESPNADATPDPLDNMTHFSAVAAAAAAAADDDITVCTACSKQRLDSPAACPACYKLTATTLLSGSPFSIPILPGKQLTTPPPSEPSSPRRLSDADEPAEMPRRTRARISYANEALSSAFASQAEGSSLFPRAFYRPLERTCSDQRTIPRRTPSSTSSTGTASTPASLLSFTGKSTPLPQSSRPTTPELKPVDGYAPMAAGFARLSRKDRLSGSDYGSRTRSTSSRPSTDLNARMFDGPA